MSTDDWWGPGLASPNFKFPDTGGDITELQQQLIEKMEKLAAKIGIEPERRMAAIERVLKPPTGTINCSAVNAKGEMSGATTTSGLAWKIPGRAGDSPIIGAGCYCDQDVGAAGATGNGEENIKVCGGAHHRRKHASRHVARRSRHGRAQAHRPQLQRRHAQAAYMDMTYYILRNDGAYACVSLWAGPPDHPRSASLCTTTRASATRRRRRMFQGASLGWPPMPGGKKLKPEAK